MFGSERTGLVDLDKDLNQIELAHLKKDLFPHAHIHPASLYHPTTHITIKRSSNKQAKKKANDEVAAVVTPATSDTCGGTILHCGYSCRCVDGATMVPTPFQQ